jgi:hypothetical protein
MQQTHRMGLKMVDLDLMLLLLLLLLLGLA